MGLLDGNIDYGLLGAASGLLTPVSQGGGWGAAAQGLLHGRAQMEERDLKRKQMEAFEAYRRAQMDELQAQAQERRAKTAIRAQQQQAMAGLAPTLPQGFDMRAPDAAQTRAQIDPAKIRAALVAGADPKIVEAIVRAEEMGRPEVKEFVTEAGGSTGERKVGVTKYGDRLPAVFEQPATLSFQDLGGSVRGLNNRTGQPVGPEQFKNDPNKPFARTADGTVANMPLQNYEINKSAAGATRVSLPKIEMNMGDSAAKNVGEILNESRTQAAAARQQADAATRILQAMEKGPIFSGPGANFRTQAARLADTMGVAGKDTTEKIANTRQAVRGLAELGLNASKYLSGQGAVSNYERDLVTKAATGDIDNLTDTEIRDIANLTMRAAKAIDAEHARKMKIAREKPTTNVSADFYDLPPMPEYTPAAPASSGGGWSIKRK